MYTRLAKAFYFLTAILFVASFLYIYASLPQQVAYELNSSGNLEKGMSRDGFFFVSIVIFIGLNLILVIPAKMVENQVMVKARSLFSKGSPFRESLLSWVYSFSGVININLVLLVFYILRINLFDGNAASDFDFLYYIIPLLLVGWIIALFVLLGKKVQQVQDSTKIGKQ
ncbi:MAG TPA: hypothetical protein VK014_11635 [Cyclobacteriaceae bacterium]|nr:hypothetical protein [Cyclobacteriaceae bacterium]